MTAAEKKGGRVVRLQAESVKRIRAVDITPGPGPTVVIRGNNAAGKSSVLDSIQYALGGKSAIASKPIREGAESAKIVLELEDLVVERKFTATGSTLEVRSKEGAKYPSPQSLLDRLVGDLSFDPHAFTRLRPEEQVARFAKVAGFDLAEWEAQRRGVFDLRTGVNRDVSQLDARLKAAPKPEGDPQPVDPKALVDEMGKLMERDRARAAAVRDADAAQAEMKRYQERRRAAAQKLQEAREAVVAAEQQVAQAEEQAKVALQQCEAKDKAVESITDPAPEMQRVREQLGDAEKTNALARQAAEHRALAAQLEAKRAESRALTQRLEKLDDERAETLKAAPMPVAGLAIGEQGLTLNGIPFEQASQAEQLQVAVAIGIRLNPSIRVLLVRDASLLDESSMAALARMAEESGTQVWTEVVGTEGVGIVIEDGAVRAAPATSEKPAQGNLL